VNTALITPVILTFNEQDNIARCLAGLHWARRIVVLDSGSTDETEAICRSHPRVDWHTRPFDHFAGQWNHARLLVRTPWMLALDADYLLPREFPEALSALPEEQEVSGWRIPFVYCIGGRPLRATLLPPRLTLFRPEQTTAAEDGHTQTFVTRGRIGDFPCPVWHDDRKPFSRWWANQKKYARQEAQKLRQSPWHGLSPQDKLRKATPLAPLAVAAFCLLGRGLILDIPRGWIYTAQRTLAELLLLQRRWESPAED
jgi:hypothetical protein